MATLHAASGICEGQVQGICLVEHFRVTVKESNAVFGGVQIRLMT